MELRDLLVALVLVWVAAKIAGEAMERVGEPAVLGELLAGVLIGPGVLGLVHESPTLHAFAELGVLMLLFEVGLDSGDARGRGGVAAPFAAGFALMWWHGHPAIAAVCVGATLAIITPAWLKALWSPALGVRQAYAQGGTSRCVRAQIPMRGGTNTND